MRKAKLKVVRLRKKLRPVPSVFVITAYKDGGAMGFDEWALVSLHHTLDMAKLAARAYIVSREDLRWWPTIIEKEVR